MESSGDREAPPVIVEFHEMIEIRGFCAHLGDVEQAEHESYVPLVVDRIVQEGDLLNQGIQPTS
jgi:hypothetical protein